MLKFDENLNLPPQTSSQHQLQGPGLHGGIPPHLVSLPLQRGHLQPAAGQAQHRHRPVSRDSYAHRL